jgi:hypothetical protein
MEEKTTMRTWSIALFQVMMAAVLVGFGKMLIDWLRHISVQTQW